MSGTRDIHIGGSVDGGMIIVGDRNTVSSQQLSCILAAPLQKESY